jgi:hypothetical protein
MDRETDVAGKNMQGYENGASEESSTAQMTVTSDEINYLIYR